MRVFVQVPIFLQFENGFLACAALCEKAGVWVFLRIILKIFFEGIVAGYWPCAALCVNAGVCGGANIHRIRKRPSKSLNCGLPFTKCLIGWLTTTQEGP